MKIPFKNTVLLILSRSLPEEVRHKPLLHKKGVNRHLYRQLNNHLKEIVLNSGLPAIWWDSCKQTKNTFADNFKQAFDFAFAQNYEQVIAIGNDCPMLTCRDLWLSAQILQKQNYVFGPATDGGVYLLGISRSGYQYQLFHQVRWQTGYVLNDLKKAIQHTAYDCLQEKSDIDDLADLYCFSKLKGQYHFALNIYLFLLTLQFDIQHFNLFPRLFKCSQSISLRAPPPLLSI